MTIHHQPQQAPLASLAVTIKFCFEKSLINTKFADAQKHFSTHTSAKTAECAALETNQTLNQGDPTAALKMSKQTCCAKLRISKTKQLRLETTLTQHALKRFSIKGH